MNNYDFQDRVAVITGGAQGIGRAVAERILASGGRVSIWDRDKDLLNRAVSELGTTDCVQGLATDIADLARVERSVGDTRQRFGRIDVLINNAAIVGPNALLGSTRRMPSAMS